VKTTIVIDDKLHYELKVQAAKERTDVSRLLCKLAVSYLAKKGK